MSKLLTSQPSLDGSVDYLFQCIACGNSHGVRVGPGVGPRWTFNGNMASPTFSPSLRVMGGPNMATSCHLNVTGGRLVYHSDSPHAYAGKTVDMEDYEAPVAAEQDPQPEPAPAPASVKPVCPICKGSGKVTFKSSPLCTGVRACSCTEE